MKVWTDEGAGDTAEAVAPAAQTGPTGRTFPTDDSVPEEWQIGDVILDLYEVKDIKTGGRGTVYRVGHKQWNIDLAVKSPHPQLFTSERHKQDFVREAEAWINIGLHPHIVSCFYVRRLGKDRVPRVFAEYVEGGSLEEWIRNGKLYEGGEEQTLERILDIAIQTAWGLDYAHEFEYEQDGERKKGLVHRDFKPANVMMTLDGTAKVTDFGGGLTPAHCSPEQKAGIELTRQTDIWSWAVSVLEMFTGGAIWLSGHIADYALAHYLNQPKNPALPRMPAALADLLKQCLARDPNGRPATMAAVADALQIVYAQCIGRPYPREKPNLLDLRADSLNNKAVSYLDLGREEEAVRCWQEALQADPAHLEANFNYGYYRWQRAEIPGSRFLDEFLLLERHQSRPEYWSMLGWIYLKQGNVEEIKHIRDKIQDQRLLEILKTGNHLSIRKERHITCSNPVNCIAVHPQKGFAWVGIESAIHEINLDSLSDLGGLEIHAQKVTSIAISPSGCFLLSGSEDDTVRVWSLFSYLGFGSPPWLFKLWIDEFNRQVRPYQQIRVMQGNEGLRVWQNGGLLPRAHQGGVNAVAVSPDENFGVSVGNDGLIKCWDLGTGRELKCFRGHTYKVISIAISADGSHVLVGGSGHVCLWDLRTGVELLCLEGHKDSWVNAVAFIPKSKMAVSGSTDGTLRLWDLKTGEMVGCLQGHRDSVNTVAVSPNGRYILSGSDDETIRLWELHTRREICRLEEHLGAVTSIAFTTKGSFLSGSEDCHLCTLALWSIKYPKWRSEKPSAWHLSRVHETKAIATIQHQVRQQFLQARNLLEGGKVADAYNLLRQIQAITGYEHASEVSTFAP